MPRPDEGLIHAWLDGELDAAESTRVEALVANDAEWAAAAAEARGLIAASSRIVGALDHVPAGVIPAAKAPAKRRAARWWMARVAALVVVVAGASVVWRQRAPTLTAVDAVGSAHSAAKDVAVSAPATAPANAPTTATASPHAVVAEPVPPKTAEPARLTNQSLTARSMERLTTSKPAPPATADVAAVPAAPGVAQPAAAPTVAAVGGAAPTGKAVGGVAATEPRAKASAPAEPAAMNRIRDARPLNLSDVVVTTPDVTACYLVRVPAALAGRTVVHPPDSLSRALWASAGVQSDSLVLRGDSLRYATVHGTQPLAVRVPCPR